MDVFDQTSATMVQSRGENFLAALSGSGPIPAETVAIIVAHPDDETIGIGGQLPRLEGVTILHITDGAPRSMTDAAAHGFASPQAYAAARRQELEAAMALAGIVPEALVSLDVPDQDASNHLVEITARIAEFLQNRGIEIVVTHAFEGGHPDHDATAFAVHGAARQLGRRGMAPAIVEVPLYHLGLSGWTVQRFVTEAGRETLVTLSDEQRRLKQAMLDAHVTQRQVLSRLATDVERFRLAPAYDFGTLPNEGRLLYDLYGWGMTGARWHALARAALDELAVQEPA
jgi:LmbE family N-acetylglucosaminyl deacetylase